MKEKTRRAIAFFEVATGVGIILFWVGFFTVGLAPETPPPCYFAFEHSFPLPDTMLAVVLITAGLLLRRGAAGGRELSLVAAGALTFLGVLDFSFNIQNGMYGISTADAILNGFINAYCAVFGVALAVMAGRVERE